MLGLALALMLLAADDAGVDPADVRRFPWPLAECVRRRDFARAHHERVVAERWDDTAWMQDSGWRADAWGALAEAKRLDAAAGSLLSLRVQLASLRELVGDDDYQLGRMPDFLPAHRFQPRER
ncbi:MAG TPA: hypothetical protein VD931_01020 [Baekduia sp.]|nr:hypothetical protein [Baekduia sp.]